MDGIGRPTRPRYLRLSITARCNLSCMYCRPKGNGADTGYSDELTPEQLQAIVRAAVAEGVTKVRLTGGEPLLRDDLEEAVRLTSAVPGVGETTLTTNGIGLAERAHALKDAGLDRVNVSLDTLKPERFRQISGADHHASVLEGIGAAARLFRPVKLNVVLMGGVNDDEIEPLVRFAAARRLWLRFIERYSSKPVPTAGAVVPMDEVRRRVESAFGPLEPAESPPLSVEESYRIPSLKGSRLGLIRSATAPPCSSCSKLRVTASGHLLPCLYSKSGVDLRESVRRLDHASLRSSIRAVFSGKQQPTSAQRAEVPLPLCQIGG